MLALKISMNISITSVQYQRGSEEYKYIHMIKYYKEKWCLFKPRYTALIFEQLK